MRGCGGEGTNFCKPYRYESPQRVWFLAHFGLELGMVFERTMGEYEHSYCFDS